MTPNPQPTRQEQADELAAAAHKAATVGDLVFARELMVRAGELRELDMKERQNENH